MFRLAKLSLHNRAVVALVTIAIVLGGVLSMASLKQELIPSLQIPAAVVVGTYPGAAPAIVERQVSEPVEGAIRGVEGVESINTTSMNSVSTSIVMFRYGTVMDTANQRLTTAVGRIAAALPEEVETQVITGSMDDFPIVQLAIAGAGDGGTADPAAVARAVDGLLVPELEQLPEVRTVSVSGYSPDQITLALDTAKMADAGVDAAAVTDVLKNYGLQFPAGSITEDGSTHAVQLGQPITSADQLAAIPLAVSEPPADDAGAPDSDDGERSDGEGSDGEGSDGESAEREAEPPAAEDGEPPAEDGEPPAEDAEPPAEDAEPPADEAEPPAEDAEPPADAPAAPVRLGDIATVTQEPAAATSHSRLNGDPAVAVAVTKTPAGNTVEVSHAVADVIAELEPILTAEGLSVAVVFDQAPFIERSISGLTQEGLLGLGFAIIIILVFLVSVRSTLVSAVSIPLSLLATFIVMRMTGETLNMLTLGAMTIAIGRVVDDSIVVVENIKRHLSYGERKRDAIITAVREVGGAIAASTVCTVAVFAPIALVGGMVGELFRPFALTVAIALAASLLVSLTIVPVLAYWFVKRPVSIDQADIDSQRAAAEAKERRGLWQRAYIPTLRASLRRPAVALLVAVAVLGGTVALIPQMKTDFLGNMGQDTITVTQTFTAGTALEVQDAESRVVEAALVDLPEVAEVQTTVGSAGFMGIQMGTAPTAEFAITLAGEGDSEEAQKVVGAAVEGLGGERTVSILVSGEESMIGSTTIDLEVRSASRDTLTEAARLVEQAARETEGATNVVNNLTEDVETVQVTVDRAKAAALGLTETQVMGLAAGLIAPSRIGALATDDGDIDVRVALAPGPDSLAQLRGLPLAAG
ncbi:MAG: efflux RND transporter permease subunit, partial [Bifidobacteriaceae bacterium]|nr:efflux RND transporter permease subunit [Bifidobacteriaceae bacterium]